MLSCFSRVQLFATLWTIAYCPWDSPGMNTGVGLSFPSAGDIPDPGVEPQSLVFPALTGGFFTTSTTWEAPCLVTNTFIKDLSYVNIPKYICPQEDLFENHIVARTDEMLRNPVFPS